MPSSFTFQPQNTSTLEDFIDAGRLVSITYDKFSYKEKLSNGTEICVLNIVNDYMTELKEVSTPVKLTDKQYQKYRFKPKLLCYDIYGNPELYYIILLINGIADVKDFDFTILRMLTVDNMNILLSYIYNAEKQYMLQYNTDKGTL